MEPLDVLEALESPEVSGFSGTGAQGRYTEGKKPFEKFKSQEEQTA